MASVNLLPNDTVSNSPAWSLSAIATVHSLLDDDDSGFPAGDGSQIYTTAAGKKCVIQFEDFDDTDVASIDSVQAVIKADIYARGQTYQVGMAIGNNGTGAASWAAADTGTQYSFHNWRTHSFSPRTTSTSGGDDWETEDVDNITMTITADAVSGNTLRVSYAYFIVTFTVAVAVTDNATFFGANF